MNLTESIAAIIPEINEFIQLDASNLSHALVAATGSLLDSVTFPQLQIDHNGRYVEQVFGPFRGNKNPYILPEGNGSLKVTINPYLYRDQFKAPYLLHVKRPEEIMFYIRFFAEAAEIGEEQFFLNYACIVARHIAVETTDQLLDLRLGSQQLGLVIDNLDDRRHLDIYPKEDNA